MLHSKSHTNCYAGLQFPLPRKTGPDNRNPLHTADGFSFFFAAIVGHKLGEKRTDLAIVYAKVAMILSVTCGIIMCSIMVALRKVLVGLYKPDTDYKMMTACNCLLIAAAACMLPLASDKDIAKELGTRHRAGIGISKESDSIAIIVSEETGKVSVAKDGTLIADVREDVLKKILISNIVTKRLNEAKEKKKIKSFKETVANIFKKEEEKKS